MFKSTEAILAPIDQNTGRSTAVYPFMVFAAGRQEYGMQGCSDAGLRDIDSMIPLYNAPEFIVGVIHTHGVIAPVIDLRYQFERSTPVYNPRMDVLILNLRGHMVGVTVDRISGIAAIDTDQIKSAPHWLHVYDDDYLLGIGSIDERKIHLINTDRLVSYIRAWFLLEKAAA